MEQLDPSKAREQKGKQHNIDSYTFEEGDEGIEVVRSIKRLRREIAALNRFSSSSADDDNSGDQSGEVPSRANVPAGELPDYPGLVISSELARSGQAIVYRGRYNGHDVAAKVFNSGGKLKREDFSLTEFDIIITLQHDNVLKLFTGFMPPKYSIPCLITPYMPRGSLYDYLGMRGALSDAETWRISAGIAMGVAYLHQHNVIHRDLKSANILLNADGEPVLADFGLSCVTFNSGDSIKERAGTWPWMAPEVMQTRGASTSSDIYGVGIIMWEMLSGQRPFADVDKETFVALVQRGERPPVSDAWDLMLADTIQDCWEQRAKDRPSAEQLVQRILPRGRVDERRTRMQEAEELYREGVALLADGSMVKSGAQRIVRAVELGHAQARQVLFAELTDHFPTLTLKYLRRAALQNDSAAQWKLANLYSEYKGRSETEIEEWRIKAAHNGHAEAQEWLGLLYDPGGPYHCVVTSYEESYRQAGIWYRRAAEQGRAYAQARLGWLCDVGLGCVKDQSDKEAFFWYTKAALQGQLQAQKRLGLMYAEGRCDGDGEQRDMDTVAWFEKASHQGDGQALLMMANMLEQGRGGRYQSADAIEWYFRAAQRGYREALWQLGLMYEEGRGVSKQSYRLAAEYYEAATRQGHADAYYRLIQVMQALSGDCPTFKVKHHQLVEIDERGAVWFLKCDLELPADEQFQIGRASSVAAWFKLAALRDHPDAQYKLGVDLKETSTTSIKQEWWKKAAGLGHIEAQYELGRLYWEGGEIEESDELAAEWWEQAALQEHSEAQYELGVLYWNGTGRALSDDIAAEWWKKAAHQGHSNASHMLRSMQKLREARTTLLSSDAEAQFKRGRMYSRRYRSSEKASRLAAEWWEKAAGQGHIKSQYELGKLYQEGEGRAKSYELAAKCWEQAAGQGHAKAMEQLQLIARQGHSEAKYMLGNLCWQGRGQAKSDEHAAAEWWEQAARQGHAQAMEQLLRTAEQGHSEAQYRLGNLNWQGRGGAKNGEHAAVAASWWGQAAGQDHFYYQGGVLGPSALFCWQGSGQAERAAGQGNVYWRGRVMAPSDLFWWQGRGRATSDERAAAVFWWKEAAGQGHAQAMEQLQLIARQGHNEAQYELGNLYWQGRAQSDERAAAAWRRQAARQDHIYWQVGAMAQSDLFCWQGNGQAQSDEMAAVLWEQAAGQGHARAMEQLQRTAEQGHSEAMYRLGNLCWQGRGQAKSDERAAEAALWWKDAARQGHAQAMEQLQQMAEQGHMEAQYELGNLCWQGRRRAQRAYWWMEAGRQGHSEAQYKRELVLSNERATAAAWWARAAEQSHARAMEQLQQMAEQGHMAAQYELGNLYWQGRRRAQSDERAAAEAAFWWKEAARQGHAQATKQLLLAARQGHMEAQYELGNLYWQGKGRAQSDELAVEWFGKAARQGHAQAKISMEGLSRSSRSTSFVFFVVLILFSLLA